MKTSLLGARLALAVLFASIVVAPVRAATDIAWQTELKMMMGELDRLNAMLDGVTAAARGEVGRIDVDLGAETRGPKQDIENVKNSLATWLLEGKSGENVPVVGSLLRNKAKGDVAGVRDAVSRLVTRRTEVETFIKWRARFVTVDARGAAVDKRYAALKTWYDELSHSWVPVIGAPSDWRRDAADKRGFGKCGDLLYILGRYGFLTGLLNPNDMVERARACLDKGGFYNYREMLTKYEQVLTGMESAATQLERILSAVEELKNGKVQSPSQRIAGQAPPDVTGAFAANAPALITANPDSVSPMGLLGVATGPGSVQGAAPGGRGAGSNAPTTLAGKATAGAGAGVTTPAGTATRLEVHPGDTLWGLALSLINELKSEGKHVPSVDDAVTELASHGVPAITNPNLIYPGQVIAVPADLR